MKTAVALLLFGLFAADAIAQGVPPTKGSLALSLAPDAIVTSGSVAPLVPFEFYLLASVEAGSEVFFVLEGALLLDSTIAFARADFLPEGAANFGLRLEDGRYDFAVNYDAGASCAPAQVGLTVLASFEAVLLDDAENVFIGLDRYHEHAASSGPAWADCDREIYSFAVGADATQMLSVSASETVANEAASFGSIRRLYR